MSEILSKRVGQSIFDPKMPDWFHEKEPRSFHPKQKYRTVWISDIHLGTSGCNAELLLDFLQSIKCDTLYLVGDIVDGWRLRKGWYWPSTHNEVVRRVLKMAHKGTRVVYVPGNHDEMFRDFVGLHFGGVELSYEAIHETADGRLLLVTHGDMFDGVVLYAKWLAFLGDAAYTFLLKANIWLNAVRRRLHLPYWSLSSYMKLRVKRRWRARRSNAASMALSAAISTMPKSAISTGSLIIMTATGSKAAPRWSRTSMAI
jgi:UDP-2,3-diacylglucosamine pyrophosphatase LpxH